MNNLVVYVIVSAFLKWPKSRADMQSIAVASTWSSATSDGLVCIDLSHGEPIFISILRRAICTITLIFIWYVFSEQKLKNVRLLFAKTDLNDCLSLLKGIADLLILLEKHAVEGVCESDYSIVSHLLSLFDADHMFCTSLLKDASDKLRVASGHKNELKLALVLLNHLLELLSTNKLAATFVIFEQQEVSLSLVALIKFDTHRHIVQQPMTTEVKSKWFLSQHFLEAVRSALSLRDVDLDLGCVDAVLDLEELLREIQLLKVLECVLWLLHN